MKRQNNIPKCENCSGNFVYVKKDGSIVCRRCGFIKKKEEKEENA